MIFARHNLICNWLTYFMDAKSTDELISFGFRDRSGEATGGLSPPLSSGPLTRFAQNRWENIGVSPPRNVVPANMLVLVAHLLTFSESQWNQFHPRAKKPTALWGFPWPPQLLCPWTPLGTPLQFLHLYQHGVALNSALKTGCLLFSAVFAFEADDCGWLVG